MSEEDYKVVEAMEKYGGSFVKALANLARCADPHNLNRIKTTWDGYWKQYAKMAAQDE